MSNKFNVGDKVKRIGYSIEDVEVGGLYTIRHVRPSGFLHLRGLKDLGYNPAQFELVEPANKQFTKADLKDGMRVIYRCGDVRIFVDGELHKSDPYKCSLIWCVNIDRSFNEELCFVNGSSCDIMQVIDRDGTVLYNRVEKSQSEIELEKLQEQHKLLGDQINKLKNTL